MQSSFMISKYATSSDMAIAYDPTIPFIYVWDASLLSHLFICLIIWKLL
jgi:hypothetical protein